MTCTPLDSFIELRGHRGLTARCRRYRRLPRRR
jgi:hypothetical protein